VDFAAFAGFDAAVAGALRSIASPALTRIMWIATLSGDAAVMTSFAVLAVVLLVAWGRRRSAVVLAVVMIADPLIASSLKGMFARPRPPVAAMLIGVPSDASFPSGHALASLLCYGLLALFVVLGTASAWRKGSAVAVALVCALMVGASRVYLGVHWASDVVASWAVGVPLLVLGFGALLLWERLGGPEPVRAMTPGRRRALWALAGVCGVVLLAMLVRQAGLDPLL
jgi:undecaprenyl-diphosphatase